MMNNPSLSLGHVCYRFILLTIGMAGLWLPSGTALAQREILGAAPQMYGVRSGFVDEGDVAEAHVLLARRVPIALLLPAASSDSYLSLLYGSAGVRGGKTTPTRLRWRAGLLDFFMARPPMAFGLTLLDYDRSGRAEVEARWLALTLGPVLRLGRPPFALEARLLGRAGLTTLEPGQAHYDALGPRARTRGTGLDVGYRAEALWVPDPRLVFTGYFRQNSFRSNSNPRRRITGLEAALTPDPRLQVFTGLEREIIRLSGETVTRHQVLLGLRFIPSAGG